MCYYIARKLTDNSNSFNNKVRAIRNFVHENVHPVPGYDNRLDTVAIDKLLSGEGWCDQQSRVFMQLARSVGITSRLLFLRDEDGASPHSVAEALAPDNRWIIVDASYNLDLINSDGNFASQSDIKNNLVLIANNKRVVAQARFSKRWSDEKYLSIYSNTPSYIITKKAVRFDFLRPIPISWIRPIVTILHTRYLETLAFNTKDIYELKMLKARGYHLLGYYKKSGELYKDVIDNSNNLKLAHKAEFYYPASLKDQNKYEEAYRYITDILTKNKASPYIEYLYGLRASILEKMGRSKEAEQDLLKIKHALDSS
ncbi:MAG: transglutaminase domain-containing protein [Candidatus Omnitrophica bacterium]|nr:transglutaminase domain-containing protein [Candidatus Omnitrophota bacterium]